MATPFCKFITVIIILPNQHDKLIAHPCQECPPMFEDIHALVQFAEAGSVVRAAARLHRTPSAVTRQVQRLESALGAELLDRTVKPPRLTPLGVRVVEQSRDVLKRVED